ncbi:hypothetical protein GCM10020331_065630 [Ectobacillus funiculus]
MAQQKFTGTDEYLRRGNSEAAQIFVFLSLILMIGIVWLLALYLNSLADRDEARSHLQETKQTIGQETDTALLKTVEGFCRELYGPQPDRARIASYTTPRGKSVFFCLLREKEAKSNIQIQMKIHSISVYSGVVKEKAGRSHCSRESDNYN